MPLPLLLLSFAIVNYLLLLFYMAFLLETYVALILPFSPSTYFYLRLNEVPQIRVLDVLVALPGMQGTEGLKEMEEERGGQNPGISQERPMGFALMIIPVGGASWSSS